ncbi:MAG: hypothetical protein NT134_00025, partial [Chloroflexi bacterium]|nr:hypothetical protein [Chloroflexota bacterium]
MKKIHWLGITLALFVALVVVMAVMVASYIEMGVTSEIGTGGQPLLAYDVAEVPPSIIDDASEVAAEIFGDDEAKCRDFAAQLLASYAEAKDHDFVLVFNSGGWGWNLLEESPGWWGIFEGIDAELATWNYSSVKLDYLRATPDFKGRLDEFWEALIGYRSKAEVLAARTEFLTDHLPDIRVILAGESTGAVIIDSAMVIMGDNPRVYSIQAGPPFWHETITKERSLIMMGNGVSVDTLSYGNGFGFILGCYEKWFGALK